MCGSLFEARQQRNGEHLQATDSEHRTHVHVFGNPMLATCRQQRPDDCTANRAQQYQRDGPAGERRCHAFRRGKAILLYECIVDAVQANAETEHDEAGRIQRICGGEAGCRGDCRTDGEAGATANAPHQQRGEHRGTCGTDDHDRLGQCRKRGVGCQRGAHQSADRHDQHRTADGDGLADEQNDEIAVPHRADDKRARESSVTLSLQMMRVPMRSSRTLAPARRCRFRTIRLPIATTATTTQSAPSST